jgi:hypothetical protein
MSKLIMAVTTKNPPDASSTKNKNADTAKFT